MKKQLLIAGFIIVFYSCKKDNADSTANTDTSITGKWYFTADTLKQYNNGSLQFSDTNFSSSNYVQFNNDGTGTSGTSETAKFTYTIDANVITINTPQQTVGDPTFGSVTIDANIEKATIKKVTSNNLELYFDDKNTDGTEDTEAQYFSK